MELPKKGDEDLTKHYNVVITDGRSPSSRSPQNVLVTDERSPSRESPQNVVDSDGRSSSSKSSQKTKNNDDEEDNNSTNESEDDGELKDHQDLLRMECGATEKCEKLFEELQTCNDRVNSKEMTNETCVQELFDFIGCVDHCVSKTLFKFLK